MRIENALLCEAASVREGLLYILGGGITETSRQEFPSPLKMTLAIRVLMHRTEVAAQHQLDIVLNDEDGNLITQAGIGFGLLDPEQIPVGEEVALPIPWDFPMGPQIPHSGKYSFELLIDGLHQRSVPFTANPVANQEEQ